MKNKQLYKYSFYMNINYNNLNSHLNEYLGIYRSRIETKPSSAKIDEIYNIPYWDLTKYEIRIECYSYKNDDTNIKNKIFKKAYKKYKKIIKIKEKEVLKLKNFNKKLFNKYERKSKLKIILKNNKN